MSAVYGQENVIQIVPRSYQTECVDTLFRYFTEKGGNPVCALPTGTGKSIVIALFLYQIFYYWPTQRVMILTHVKELIQQNYQKLMQVWPNAPAGINSAGLGQRDFAHSILFAGIASVAKYAPQFGHIDLVIIDEAHLVSPNEQTMYRTFISGLMAINPMLKVIGFTATPWRLGHGHIAGEEDSLFTDVAFDITGIDAFNRLIAEGFLSRLIPKQTKTLLSVDGVHMRGGDFITSELQQAVDKYDLTEKALRESLEMAHDRKHWLIFASGVEHADHIAEMLTLLGEPCKAVHSKMPDAQRDRTIADFKAGRLRAVVNNNVLTTGFDFPGIDFILMLRPTASTVLWVQMLGRGTRPCIETGKENCLVADFAGNTRRLGPINDPVIPRKKGQKGGHAPVKVCEKCDTINHASVRFCINCGFEFHFETKLKQQASTQDLVKGEIPVVELLEVEHVTVRKYEKQGRPDSIKLTYYTSNGMRSFSEYICFEHGGYASRKARTWWRERSSSPLYQEGVPMPNTTMEALSLIDRLQTPTHLRIWTNKKYPEILGYSFDGYSIGGVAFGTPPSDSYAPPSIEVYQPRTSHKPSTDGPPAGDFDDDIPF